MIKAKIMVVDDEESIRKLLKSRLEREGHEVTVCSDADEAEARMKASPGTCVMVTDLKMPGRDGFSLMEAAQNLAPQMKVIVITGHGEKEVAVKSLRCGATDYLEKPFDLDELAHAVRRGVTEYRLEMQNRDLVERLEARVARVEGKTEDQYWYVSKSPSMAKANEWITVLRREALRGEGEEPSVLILGESGTGKEGIARMVHAGSRRARGPWIAVNCANFSETLLESELFGHEKGAFTGATTSKRGIFELADGGTLFLDEVGEMDIKLQAKLLRVLQEKTFRRVGGTSDIQSDVRVIAATNQNLLERVQTGGFREDLFHRMNRVVIEVPALRERQDDIVPMARQFAERAFEVRGKKFEGFDPGAEASLKAHSWSGNVRELLNVVERVALLWEGTGPVMTSALSLPVSSSAVSGASGGAGAPGLKILSGGLESGYMDLKKQWLDSFEREFLTATLAQFAGNVSSSARAAKLDRSNFLRLLRRHGIKAEAYRKGKGGVETSDMPEAARIEEVQRKIA